jgi:glycosyltransferase involved in cell wall biosynthesis
MPIKLSIIIPTKDRYYYLEYCLRAISLSYNRPDVEIIVTDNSRSRQDVKALSLFQNLKYFYFDEPLSQVENFEYAMQNVSGDFVTMIGDDDGLSGTLLDVINYMENNKVDALVSPFVSYFWPDVITKNLANDVTGKIFLKKYNYEISLISIQKEITRCLSLGGTSLCNLPRMYYGILKRDLLNKVKEASGYFFPGPSPDMANAFSSAIFANSLVLFDAPLFIAGNSSKSAAGLGLAGKHSGKIKDNPMLPKDCFDNWTILVPRFWSGPTIWAESLHRVLFLTKQQEYLKRFNYSRLYASCLVFHSEYSQQIYDAIDQFSVETATKFIPLLIQFEKIKIFFLRAKHLLRNILNRFGNLQGKVFSDIGDVEAATYVLRENDVIILEKLRLNVSE